MLQFKTSLKEYRAKILFILIAFFSLVGMVGYFVYLYFHPLQYINFTLYKPYSLKVSNPKLIIYDDKRFSSFFSPKISVKYHLYDGQVEVNMSKKVNAGYDCDPTAKECYMVKSASGKSYLLQNHETMRYVSFKKDNTDITLSYEKNTAAFTSERLEYLVESFQKTDDLYMEVVRAQPGP